MELKPIDLDELIELADRLNAIYGRQQMAAKIGKRYNTLDNEVKHRDRGTACAKLGLETALRMIRIALLPDSHAHAREAAHELLDWIVARYGMVAFEVPAVDPNSPHAPILQLAANLAEEFGEAVTAVGISLADGKLTREEIETCEKEVRDVVRVCAELKAHLAALKK